MSLYNKIIYKSTIRRLIVLVSIFIILFFFRHMLSLFLLTFIFSFLITRLTNFIRRHINISPALIVIPVYAFIVGILYYAIAHYAPIVLKQSIHLIDRVYKFYHSNTFHKDKFILYMNHYLSRVDISDQLKNSLSKLILCISNISSAGIMFFFAFILSFFFALESKKLNHFGNQLAKSKFGWYFLDVYYFGKKFVDTFGVVIEAQIVIAFVNTILTVIALIFMKMPNILSLGIMIFFLSLIPVAGVIISLIPLTIIGYSVGGFKYVIYILLLILFIHMLEAYVLNPRFMASKTKLPVFCTFIVLLISERLFGLWGLIVGIPIFTFFLDILGVQSITKNNSKIFR